jgi:hypothetical protein
MEKKLRVLFLHNANWKRVSRRLQFDFIIRLNSYCELFVYGPYEHQDNPHIAPVNFNSKITSTDLLNIFNPDILLFLLYAPGCYNWCPFDICNYNLPSAIIEIDHYTRNSNLGNQILGWYKNAGFSLAIRRHSYEEDCSVPSIWLPFAADDAEFYPDETINKINLIGFAASSGKANLDYDIRRDASSILKRSNLLAHKNGITENYEYADYIKQYAGALTCSGGKIHTTLSKHFEIGLSKIPILSNRILFEKELFGPQKCFFEYDDNCSNIVSQANIILNDKNLANDVATNMYESCKKYHTFDIRVKELYDILINLVNGKEPERLWGQ